MTTVIEQVQSANATICRNIELLSDDRQLLSQNMLSQLRNLVEGVAVLLHTGSPDAEFQFSVIEPGLAFSRSRAKINFIGRFHRLIQKSASHYSPDGDSSERLMLKYFEYLYRIRSLLRDDFGIEALENLEDFPIDLDPSLQEYYEKIAARIDADRFIRSERKDSNANDRYYIHKTRPFFVGGRVYYEVTFYRAVNKVSKFERIIAFTDIDMTDKYSAMLTLRRDTIEVLGQTMPIMIIREWKVSIRPCEFNNFARLLGVTVQVRASSAEYRYLMHGLTVGSGSLLDLIDLSDEKYATVRADGTARVTAPLIFPILDKVRLIVRSSAPGCRVLRYLMLRMNNQIIKPQYCSEVCGRLSDMKLQYGCIPFDDMPFCTSLIGHNPRYWDIVESIDVSGREHELLARFVKNNVERHGILYTPIEELEELGDVKKLMSIYNNALYHKHTKRRLLLDKGHLFICGYEDDTVSIVESLQKYASSQIDGYAQAVERWLNDADRNIDDPAKEDALKRLFSQSRVALIYGAAGTGKSTMVNHVANYFNEKQKLFLAHTHPAVDNLKRKVTAQNAEFRTISSQIAKNHSTLEYDLLVIDEASTVSNSELIKVLGKTSFRLLVLVGDIYQIESIQFGNWFGIIRSFIPRTSVFELATPFRTTNASLLEFWNKVRAIDDDLAEVMARNKYSTVLDKTLFEANGQDEIVLCLNYDGLYGINNINRFLQSSNPNPETIWRESMYKVGDPVLFHETERFRPVIYNNLKGRIVDIQKDAGWIRFDIELDRSLSEFDVEGSELEWLEDSTVRFTVYDYDLSDEDDDSLNTSVPFQVAYAVSIHKAQGLEYDFVKIVITNANEDDITHSIFYTAITRTRKHLRIYWTPETEHNVLRRLNRRANPKDVALLASRRNLTRANGG